MAFNHFSKSSIVQLDKMGCLLFFNLYDHSRSQAHKLHFLKKSLQCYLHPSLSTPFSKFRKVTQACTASDSLLALGIGLDGALAQLNAGPLRVGVEVHQVLPLDM